MKLQQLIGDVIECAPAASLQEAARLMRGAGIGALIVMDGDALAGIITERDMLSAAAEGRSLEDETVKDWMTANVGSVSAATSVEEAAAWLLGAGYRHLPVTSGSGQIIGIVSIKDILWALVDVTETSTA